jgi:hypothetical protein
MLLSSAKTQKSKPLSLQQLKEKVAAESNLQPIVLVSAPINRKAIERANKALKVEQIYQQVIREFAAKISPQRGDLLNPPNNG